MADHDLQPETTAQRRARVAALKADRHARHLASLDTRAKVDAEIARVDAKLAALLAYDDGTDPVTAGNSGVVALQAYRTQLVGLDAAPLPNRGGP
jgi:hypothetical protein